MNRLMTVVPGPVLDAIANNGGEGFIVLLGAGALGVAGVASLVDPEAFIHITWLDGDVSRSTSVRTGFFTPFVERRLRGPDSLDQIVPAFGRDYFFVSFE